MRSERGQAGPPDAPRCVGLPLRRWPPPAPLRWRGQEGAAVVDFVLVSMLVMAAVMALLQLALGLHARNVLIDAAGEGARRAALAGGTPAEAQARVRALSDAALADGYVQWRSPGPASMGSASWWSP